jgi:hypothetical protein
MIISKDLIQSVVKAVGVHFDLEVHFHNTAFTVLAESDKGINEFEARLVAAVALEDGLEDVAAESLPVYLNLYVDIIDHRNHLKTLFPGGGTWEAIYGIIPGDETRLHN